MQQVERNIRTIQAISSGLNEFKRAIKEIGSIEIDDDYIYLEMRYLLTNTVINLEGFIKTKLKLE